MAEQAADQGHAANERGDHAAARAHFLDAYRLSSKPQFLLSAANMSLKIGSFDEARRLYKNVQSGGRMFAGFTSGTGRTHASHVITSWKFFEVAGRKVEQQEGAESFFGSLFGL